MTSSWATTVTTSISSLQQLQIGLMAILLMRLGTAFGTSLVPVADKHMVAATLVLLCTRPFEVAAFGQVPWLLPVPAIAIIGRELENGLLLRMLKFSRPAINNLGKWKTATQMMALTILLASRDSSLSIRFRGVNCFRCCSTFYLSRSCSLVIGRVHEHLENNGRVTVSCGLEFSQERITYSRALCSKHPCPFRDNDHMRLGSR